MVDPKMVNGYPVKKYTDEQVEKCREKVEFIKNRLIVDDMDDGYREMIMTILKDYERMLWEYENSVVWVPYCKTIY